MGGGRYLSLAWRNLGRNRRRTVVTAVAISLGIAMFVVVMALEDGSYKQMIEDGVSQVAGHVVIQAEGYQDDPDVALVVPSTPEIAALAQERTDPSVRVVQRAFVQGLLSSPTGASGVEIFGVQPGPEARVSDLSEKLVEGSWIEDETDIVVGRLLAETLDVTLGDRVVLMAQLGGEMEAWLFRVGGIFRTGMDEMDGFFALSHISALQQMLGLGENAHQISLHLSDVRRTGELTRTLREDLAEREVEVLPWQESVPELYELMIFDQAGTFVFLAVIGFIVALGILNTVLMSVLERTREFGVLLALGLSPRRLGALVFTESLILGVVAVSAGLVIGLLASWPMVVYGLDLAEIFGETLEAAGMGMETHLFAHVYPSRVLTFGLGGVAITLLATIYPVLKATRLQPVQAMHQR